MSKKEKVLIIFMGLTVFIFISMILIFHLRKNYLLNEIKIQNRIIQKEKQKFNESNREYKKVKKEYDSYIDQEKDIDKTIKELEDKTNE